MRLRLVHTLSILLLATVLLAVLAMGGVTAWNLRNGFSDYLFARDVERLEQFAAFVGTRAAQAGGIGSLKARGVEMRDFLDGFAQQQGLPVRPRPPPPSADGVPDVENRGPPPIHVDTFSARICIVRPDGAPLWGNTFSGSDVLVDRSIHVGGDVVAIARMVKLPPFQMLWMPSS